MPRRQLHWPFSSATKRWFANRHRACATQILRQRNIYILPSTAGMMLAATLLILLIASINFQLNLGFALTFLIAGSACASLWLGYRNMRGVQLSLRPLQATFQNTAANAHVVLNTTWQHTSYGLAISFEQADNAPEWVYTDISKEQSSIITLRWTAPKRGWQTVPRITIESRFPLGVFRLWSYWQPDSLLLVYPAPEQPAPPIHLAGTEDTGTLQTTPRSSNESDDVRTYQRGDPLRSIVWKKTASALASGSGDLVVRHSATGNAQQIWLDVRATGLAQQEAQIARLTAWVLHAHAQQWRWGLALPSGLRIAPSTGEQHLHQCLSALAIDGLPSPSH